MSPNNSVSSLNFPNFGKKAPIPSNLPVSEDGEVPDIFRQAETVVKEDKIDSVKKNVSPVMEYSPHEATPEEVKARLNRLLRGVK